jgi:hypothetical protein
VQPHREQHDQLVENVRKRRQVARDGVRVGQRPLGGEDRRQQQLDELLVVVDLRTDSARQAERDSMFV